MKKIFTNILIVTLIFSTVSGAFPATAFANQTEESEHSQSGYCKPGEVITITEAARAFNDGKILFELSTSTDNTKAVFNLVNKTGCKFPVSLSSYKMFDGVLSHQEFYSGTGLVYAEESASITVDLPSCMAQIDAWFGLYPTQLLDSNPYGYPNVPMVIAYKFLYNSGTGYHDPIGPLCKKEVPNTPPVLTLVGSSTISMVSGSSFTDPGATATDLEDGNITNKIVTTGTVNTNVVGTYTITYNVEDSKGLKAVEIKRIVNVYPPIILPTTAIISATKIVCDSEADLPNYGAGGPDISSTTATAFVAEHSNCKIVPWTFEWAPKGTANPGDGLKMGGEKWTPFTGTTTVSLSDKVWVREQFDENYISFSGLNTTKPVSAELYCDTDVLNYDNYDWLVPSIAGKTYHCVAWNVLKATSTPINTAPVITLVGVTPMNVYLGDVYVDLGATATDLEDGNITNKIVTTGTVNTNVVGTYTITYNVEDSKGLKAVEVSRTVNVLEKDVPPPTNGKITFCLVIADDQNVIATSSAGLPSGTLTTKLGTTTSEIASSTFFKTKSWDTSVFSPSSKAILNVNDSDCVTYVDLPYGVYTYTQIATTTVWDKIQYNDQDTQPVNNVFDFFSYSDTDTNSDGYIVLDSHRSERTLYILAKYNKTIQCLLPEITLALTANATVGNPFTYTLTASSTQVNLSVSTTTLPAWLSYATTTNILSGTPTATGTYNVALKAENICGVDEKSLVITVVSGGGGGGSPSSDIEVIKTADKTTVNVNDTVTYTLVLTNKGPSDATGVALSDVLPSALTFVSATTTSGSFATTTGQWTVGNLTNNASTTLTIFATVNADTFGQKIVNTATASSTVSDPNSSNNTGTFEINVNPAPCTSNCGGGGGGGGGNGPISTYVPVNGPVVPPTVTTPNSCHYLNDYLRKDFNNDPVEVKKLQVFLRDLEGFSTVQVTGVYDDQTITALNAFQDRYKGDILTPWGHTAPTSYTYILTKKKVNEIYCKTAFPVNAQQQAEIDTYRNFLQGLRDAGVLLPNENVTPSNPVNSGTPSKPVIIDGQVGSNNPNDSQGTLAGYSSTTQKFVNSLTANVIASGKKLVNSFLGLFSWPFGKDKIDLASQCADTFMGLGWLNYILILIIIIVSYLWYREYWNNKKIEEINKEINLD